MSTTTPRPTTGTDVTRTGPEALQSDKGTTAIAEGVVTKVAGLAAREVPGVHDLGGGAARALGSVTQRVGLGERISQGVSVEVGQKEAAVDLSLVIDYGESIPQVSQAVREQIVKRVEGITGLAVTEVNITVNDLYFPGDDDADEPEPRVA
jgi:uncharacterized alkaline shock family protein YloU